jgi:DNA-binding GntR family transcriptional regulator
MRMSSAMSALSSRSVISTIVYDLRVATRALTKQERVYRILRERILAGTYGPGYRMVIDSLSAEFSVSALPVREAIRRLEAEGLVVFRPNAGAQVTPTEPGLFEQEMTVLAVLEGFATALAAPGLTRQDLAELAAKTDEMERSIARMDSLAFGRLNQEFHGLIYERCPNPSLVRMANDVNRRLDAIRRTVFVQIPYRGAASVAEHRELIDLIARHASAEEIEDAARTHKMHTVQSFQEWLQTHDLAGGAQRSP